MEPLREYLHSHAPDGFIPHAVQQEASLRYALPYPAVEEQILRLGLTPERYRRNRSTIAPEQQLRLFMSHAAVVGCGGLGGHVIEGLARIGVGTLTVVDPDLFEEHNLNRQVLATMSTLHEPKAEVAARRVAEINPAVTVRPHRLALTGENGPALLGGVHVVADGLDSIPERLVLAEACEDLGIPLVHGSIAGWYGQATTQYPGDRTLQTIYHGTVPEKGVEEELGNPSFIPALVASLEVAEAVKVLLGQGTALRRRLLSVDLLDMEFAGLSIGD